MELMHAIRERRSIRGFLPEPISDGVILEMLDEARWAPSWANAQGWDVFVLKGEALERVKAMLATKFAQNAEAHPDVRMPQRGEWPEHIAERMTYRRPSPGEAPQPPQRPGLTDIYGAPALMLFGIHEQLAVEYACFDLGLLVENFCLIAEGHGYGTCIMAMVVRFGDELHELIPQAHGRRIVIGVALGRPDLDSGLNQVERKRCPLGEVAQFIG